MPYLGLYLTDLTFIEDGNPDLLLVRDETLADADEASSHQINYAKCQMVAKACNPACNSSCIPACTLCIPVMCATTGSQPATQRAPSCNPVATLCPQALGEIKHFQRAAYITLPKPHLLAWLKVSE